MCQCELVKKENEDLKATVDRLAKDKERADRKYKIVKSIAARLPLPYMIGAVVAIFVFCFNFYNKVQTAAEATQKVASQMATAQEQLANAQKTMLIQDGEKLLINNRLTTLEKGMDETKKTVDRIDDKITILLTNSRGHK